MSPTDEEFTPEERAAMKDRVREMRRARSGAAKDPAADFAAAVAALDGEEREIVEVLARLVADHAPHLSQRTWYGMPAWSLDGKVLCFIQPASKFKVRYSTLGFQDNAHLDEGTMWATSFALTAIGPQEEARIARLLEQATSPRP